MYLLVMLLVCLCTFFLGIVQLEALEILSKQCEVKLNEILGTVAKEKVRQLKLNLLTVKHHFDTDFSTDEGIASFKFPC